MEVLLCVAEDVSSMAARLAVGALKSCLPQLLHSCHSDVGLQGLLKLLQIKNNSYWLVKVSNRENTNCIYYEVFRQRGLRKQCRLRSDAAKYGISSGFH